MRCIEVRLSTMENTAFNYPDGGGFGASNYISVIAGNLSAVPSNLLRRCLLHGSLLLQMFLFDANKAPNQTTALQESLV